LLALGKITNLDEFKSFIDGYDVGIRYMDDHIGYVLEALENQGVTLNDLCVIITSDHGENMGELGLYAEHGTADRATCRIPMIIKWVGGKAGIVDDDIHGNIDLCPTIADLLGTQKHDIWDGESYANVITTGESQGRDHIVLSQNAHVCQRSVRFGKWLYMRTYHDGYHLFPRDMLFDIESDRYEQHDVADEHPEVVREAVQLYLNWHDEMMATSSSPTDPMRTVLQEGGPFHANGHLKRYVERLRETGRADKAELLIQKHPKEFE